MKNLLLPILLLFLAPALSAQERSLASRLDPLVKAHKGKITIAVKHLVTGETFFLDPDEVMATASLIKFMVMIEVYQQAAEGKIKLTDMVTLREKDKVPGSGILRHHFSEGAAFPLRDAVRLMIVYSDNTATNLVLDKIGIDATGKRMKEWGLPNSKINAMVFRGSTTSVDPEATKKFGLGSTTAGETVLLLEKLHQGKLVSPDACKEMIGHLKKCDDKTRLKRLLPPGTEVAHKTGSVSDAKTDAGIIYTSAGPVAVCVLTWKNADKRFVDANAANIVIGRIGREVYDHFTADKKK